VGEHGSVISTPKEKEQKEVLVQLSLWQLLQVGLTQNHVRNGFIALGVLWGWASQFNFFSDDEMEAELGRYATEGIQWGMYMITVGALIFVIGSVIISLVQSVLKYFNLKAFLSSKAVHVNAGLLKRHEYTIPIQKIQFIEWYDNILRRIPGFELVRIYQGQSENNEAKQRVEIPACYQDQTTRIMERLFPESLQSEHAFTVGAHWTQFLVLFLVFAIPVTIGFGLAGYFSGKMAFFLALAVYLPLAALFSWKFYRSVRLYTNGQVLVYTRGWLFSRRTVLKLVKVQNVAWSQTIFQRRRGTAHLHLHTAAGSRSIRFLPAEVVKQFHNYLLYRVETFEGKWM
jgi:putative membrane protein